MRFYYWFLILGLFYSSCSLALKIKTGEQAYQLKHYQLATELYSEEYKRLNSQEDKIRVAKKIALSYEKLNDLNKAFVWYSEMASMDQETDALYKLAYSAKNIDSLQLAKKIFARLYEVGKDRDFLTEKKLVEELVAARKSKQFSIDNLKINTPYSDYAALSFEEKYTAFVSDRPEDNTDDLDPGTGRNFSNLFLTGRKADYAFPFSDVLNSSFSEGPFCFANNFSEVYFTRCEAISERNVHCRIYKSQRFQGEWIDAEPIIFFDEQINVGHPAYLEQDSILIFSINESEGSRNLYFSQKGQKTWSSPQKMPDAINLSNMQMFPTIQDDTLFFSSDKRPGYGGLDIYSSFLDANGFWTAPTLLSPPYNSGADDFSYSAKDLNDGVHTSVAMISSNRIGGQGLDDIYRIYALLPEEDPTEKVTIDDKTFRTNLVIRVTDKNKKTLPDVIVEAKGSYMSESFNTNDRGFLVTEIKQADRIRISARKKGYFAETKALKILDPEDYGKDTTIQVNLLLEDLEIGKEIILSDIYYDLNKWDIRDDAKPSLNALVKLMKENPSIKIQLNAHTDCRATDDYNLELSSKRASSAKNFLISQGIAKDRLSSQGFGETQPQVSCICEDCTEEQHQLNRRTSFTIISD